MLGVLLMAHLSVAFPPHATASRPLNFKHDILPIFERHGCNTSSCHGKADGQNGFKLSVFGFDPDADFRALTMEGRGRRVFPGWPAHSLMLLKASGGVPHGGGVRIGIDTPEYSKLERWIKEGSRFGEIGDPSVVRLEVSPRHRQMKQGSAQALRVMAIWSDSRRENVTRLAVFQSNNDNLATVNSQGVVRALDVAGSAAVMASYGGHVAVFEAIIPREESLQSPPSEWEVTNRIDELIHERLGVLRIAPSSICDDETFLRRVSLDICGTLPTAKEARRFLADPRPDRREQLVGKLLEDPNFVSYWTLYWADLLRVNRQTLGYEHAHRYHQWIHRQVEANTPLDVFASRVLAVQGPLKERPAGLFYRSVSKPQDMAATISQVFLGVRIQCAQCHHHPWDRWGQDDYFGMQAVFAEVGFKSVSRGDALINKAKPSVTRHSHTGEVVAPRALGQSQPLEEAGRREQLAAWLTAPSNPWFARNLANRIWARLMGRGLVEPVDDFRSTNPASHPELLEHLAEELRSHDYDMRHLIRHIVSSRAYQRATATNTTNGEDAYNFSRYPLKMLPAEVVLDAVCQVTGIEEKFSGMPQGERAIELWDSHVSHDFLRLFGRPQRETACECERVSEPNVGQVLHLLNSPAIHDKIGHARGRIRRLIESTADDGEVVEELYLTCFSRLPSKSERASLLRHIKAAELQADSGTLAKPRQQAFEDIVWSLMNTMEFLLNH